MAEPFIFKVNLGGMIDILANHLYSSPDVFIRELLQNGTDAISGRKRMQPDFHKGRIAIRIHEKEGLSFADNGTGLTEEEIHQFLAVIGQSSKRDLQTGRILEDYIGRFGIGMLSCFMVTDKIIMHTKSVKHPEKAYAFEGCPDGTYSITELESGSVPEGTTVILKAKKGCESYFTEQKVCELVRYYGLPLPFPVMLCRADGSEERINVCFPETGEDFSGQVMALGKDLFGTDFLGYIPLESKTGLFSGVAYIMPYAVSVHAKNTHRIYLKNMLLTEDGESILPKWSGFLRCFLNTSQLRPTASRESFYEDALLEQARQELSQCISEYLTGLSQSRPELLQEIIRIHFMAVKSMACEDEDFFRTFIPFLKFETNMGELTGKELLTRTEPVSYALDMNQFHRTSALMLSQSQMLINACYVYDAQLLRMMQEYEESFVAVPLEYTSFEEVLQNPPAEAFRKAEALLGSARRALEQFGCDAELKAFSPSQLPVFYLLDENANIKREIQHSRENASDLFFSMLDAFAEEVQDSQATLFLNWNNPLIQKLISLENPQKQKLCIEILYVQNLLTGRFPMQGSEMAILNQNLITLIEWGLS
ncbi:MAG: HSP90 family protein [Oscillospiraceae bacterium]|nr:HSP90 family protein [Oscillospiraceae bacterium]